ncbi:MAG: radical SAM protein [Polyangiales bacterium]
MESAIARVFGGKKIARVLLVRPPDIHAGAFNYDAGKRKRHSNYPPYGLLVLATNLRQIGVEVAVADLHLAVLRRCFETVTEAEFDFDLAWQEELDREIARVKPDLIGVTCMFTMTHQAFVETCRHASMRGAPIAIGGVHVTNDTDHVLDQVEVADFAFLREADRAFRDFVEVVNGARSSSELAQVVANDRRHAPDRVARVRLDTDARPTAAELDVAPAFDLVDVPSYSRFGIMGSAHFMKPHDTRFATVLSNRGCRARCTFCSVRNFNGEGVRTRSVGSVIDEIEGLRDRHGVEHIMWLDDDLFYDHGRAIALFSEMARRRLGVTWDAANGVLAASCTPEVIAAAAASGCVSLTIGMESGNRKVLRKIRKPAAPETLLKAAEALRAHPEIFVRVFLMLGFPGETVAALRDTIDLATTMGLDWHTITKLQGLPNTEIYKDLVELGRARRGQDTRYSLNTYGHNRREDPLVDVDAWTPEAVLDSFDQAAVPTPEQLDALWFVMNYVVNFRRIFHETRPEKLTHLLRFTRHIADTVAPEHGFALYFQGYLLHALGLEPDPSLVGRIRRQLDTSETWSHWFRKFNLSADDLERGVFPAASHAAPRATRAV